MRAIRFVMAGLLVTGLVVMAEAQQRGGFGGGGFGQGPAQLVVNETVQKDLKLTEEQIEKVKTWQKDFQAKQFEGFAALKDLSKEERMEKIPAIAAESRKTAYKDLAGVLKPEQVDRLKQIERQALGVQAFSDAETAAALKLTDSQKSKIKAITEEYQKDVREAGGGFGGGKGGGKGGFDKEKMAESAAKREKITKSALADIDEALTADQRKTWKDLTGEVIDRSKLAPTFGGGFGKGKNKAKD